MESNRLYISYFLNKRGSKGPHSVYMRITIAGKRESVHTGVSVHEKSWDAEKAKVKGSGDEAFSQNNLLATLKAKATEIYSSCLKKETTVTSAMVKAKLTTQDEGAETLMTLIRKHNEYVKKKVGIELAKSTLVKYETLRLKVQGYISSTYKKSDIILTDLNNAFLVGFELYLKTDGGIKHNTTIKYIQFLKRVLNYGISIDWLKNDPFRAFRCSFEVVNRGYLTSTELKTIQNKVFTTPRLTQVRDIFLFSCYTGLSYSDVKKLTAKEIVTGVDGELWIQTFRTKTKTRVPIPLLPQALSILSQYEQWRVDNSKTVMLPVVTNQKMNAYLKEIAALCDIEKNLTFHLARHTFATTITLSNGVPIETVSKLLGHTNIKTTQIYSKVVDTKISEDMLKLKGKLGNDVT